MVKDEICRPPPSSSGSAQRYWIKAGTKIRGPITGDKLKKAFAAGKLKPEYLIGKSEDGPWTLVSKRFRKK